VKKVRLTNTASTPSLPPYRTERPCGRGWWCSGEGLGKFEVWGEWRTAPPLKSSSAYPHERDRQHTGVTEAKRSAPVGSFSPSIFLKLFLKPSCPSGQAAPSPALHQQALRGVAGHMQQVEPVADVGGDVHHGRVGLSGGTEGGHGAAAEVGEADGHGAVEAD
jgi:hypothetical protein